MKPLARVEKLTVEMALPEDGADERRNGFHHESLNVTWCMKDRALSVALMKAKQIRKNAQYVLQLQH